MRRPVVPVVVLRGPALLHIAALLCSTVLVAGCTVGPSQRPPVAVRGENMPPLPTAAAQPAPFEALPEPDEQRPRISFAGCTADPFVPPGVPLPTDRTLRTDCGEIRVPTDPGQPGQGGISLDVVRVGSAAAPQNRPPLLVLGDSAGEASAGRAAQLARQVAPALLERYTLVGLDRRGAGQDLLDCSPDDARAALVDADPGVAPIGTGSELLEQARSVVQECTLAVDGSLLRYRTAATAADVEILRAALGVERLSAIGVGDGAAALATWARSAPSAVGRLVLDGPPQPQLDEPERSESRAQAAEAAFDAFATACTARQDCTLSPEPRSAVSAIVERLRARPLAAVDGRRLTAGGAMTAVLSGLGEPRTWPALATALAAAGAGDPSPLLDVLAPVTGPAGRFDGMLATTCTDTRHRLAPGEIGALAADWRVGYPLFGGLHAVAMLACAPWPTGGPTPDGGSAEGAPPILVLGTAADPRGPLEGSRRAADSLASARFLGWQGAGTGAYPRTPCVSEVVDAMLIRGVAPRSGTLCPP